MKKLTRFSALLCFVLSLSFGEEENALDPDFKRIIRFREFPSLHRLYTLDTTRLNLDRIDTIFSRAGISAIQKSRYARCYEVSQLLKSEYRVCAFIGNFIMDQDTSFSAWNRYLPESLSLKSGLLTGHLDWQVVNFSIGTNRNSLIPFWEWAHAVQLQPKLAQGTSLYLRLEPKKSSEVWKRNYLSTYWAVQYLKSNNPVHTNTGLLSGLGITIELFHAIPILGGPIMGKTNNEKIGISLVGLTSLALWKTFLTGALLTEMAPYQTIARSGYGYPRNSPFEIK